MNSLADLNASGDLVRRFLWIQTAQQLKRTHFSLRNSSTSIDTLLRRWQKDSSSACKRMRLSDGRSAQSGTENTRAGKLGRLVERSVNVLLNEPLQKQPRPKVIGWIDFRPRLSIDSPAMAMVEFSMPVLPPLEHPTIILNYSICNRVVHAVQCPYAKTLYTFPDMSSLVAADKYATQLRMLGPLIQVRHSIPTTTAARPPSFLRRRTMAPVYRPQNTFTIPRSSLQQRPENGLAS